jgi:patatin-like phospholipase/acyl hydrolase
MGMIKVLSLDGGGIRGILTLVWLTELEKNLDEPLHEYFDLIIGTSTGSIIGCALSSGISASDVLKMYMRYGGYIFDNGKNNWYQEIWFKLKSWANNGLSSPKYSGEGLKYVMNRVFSKTKLKDLKIPTMITTYDLRGRKPRMFKSFDKSHEDLLVAQVCKASASAPTFFPAEIMILDGEECPIIDGGVVSNNPSLCGVAEALRLYDNLCVDQVILASFGTGESITEITVDESQEWGKLEWALPIIDVLFDGSSSAIDYICNKVLTEENFFRFQAILDDSADDMDDYSEDNMKNLHAEALKFLADGGRDKIKSLADKLKEK